MRARVNAWYDNARLSPDDCCQRTAPSMYVFWAGSVGACAIVFSEYNSGISTRAKTLSLRYECTIKDLISPPSVFRASSCDFVDRPRLGVETRSTKYETARKNFVGSFQGRHESSRELIGLRPLTPRLCDKCFN